MLDAPAAQATASGGYKHVQLITEAQQIR
jgi:hypothetical protein